GFQTLFSDTIGSFNTAAGESALYSNTTGIHNTANGFSALQTNDSGNYNTGDGFQALYSNKDGGGNVANGWQALYSNTSGGFNTGVGVSTLRQNTTGKQNTAAGVNALYNNLGSNNVAVGFQAGQNLTTGNYNIVIGAGLLAKAGEANTTRIGKNTQAATYIGGIYNKNADSSTAVPVLIDSTGKLGTVEPSARYKEAIKPMDKTSDAILALKPVTFRYKHELDPDGIPQFGLIAEQVEKVNPDLVVRGEDGKVMSVRYEAVNAMLLNEFLKENRKVQELEMNAAQQQKHFES